MTRIENDSRPVMLGDDREALLLVGHGTRDPAGIAEFFAAADLMRELAGGRPLTPCFLELATPTIAEGVEQLVRSGATRIIVVPLLLFAAGHAKRDIPDAIAAAASRYPDVEIEQTAPLECDRHILVLSERRFREAIAQCAPTRAEQTLLVLVGRGSLDPEATAEMHRFAQLRAEQSPIGRISVCFLAMQQPSLADGLDAAAASEFRQIVVQPHLLFAGELYEQLRREVEAQARSVSDGFSLPRCTSEGLPAESEPPSLTLRANMPRKWVLTAPLGPEPELAAAVMNLVEQNCRARQQVT
jgi:sirohydrochlorin cobaltochelatase